MYTNTETAAAMRRYISLSLAWWHSLKHAVHQVWKFFALELWAPLWHHLYPADLFLIKGKSPQDEISHLLYVAYAYPDFADDLRALVTERTLTAGNIAMVKDFIFLFEFAIPAVTFFPTMPTICFTKCALMHTLLLHLLFLILFGEFLQKDPLPCALMHTFSNPFFASDY